MKTLYETLMEKKADISSFMSPAILIGGAGGALLPEFLRNRGALQSTPEKAYQNSEWQGFKGLGAGLGFGAGSLLGGALLGGFSSAATDGDPLASIAGGTLGALAGGIPGGYLGHAIADPVGRWLYGYKGE